MSVSAIPEGYHSITPYLTVDDPEAALDFYARAFGAETVMRMEMGGTIAHAEIRIGNSFVMLSGEWPDMDKLGPKARGGATASLMVYLGDVDAAFRRALEAGATEERAPENQFWGDRMGVLKDPFGHSWMLATHVEDVAEDEMERRIAAAGAAQEA